MCLRAFLNTNVLLCMFSAWSGQVVVLPMAFENKRT